MLFRNTGILNILREKDFATGTDRSSHPGVSCNFIKKRDFPVNFAKFSRAPFL